MTSPTTPATITRLRELIAAATAIPWCGTDCHGHLECREIGYIGDIELHSPTSPFVRSESKDDAALIVEAVNALPAILDQLAAQAAEIERVRGDLDTAKRDAEEAKAFRNGMHVKNFSAMRDAQARVAELERLAAERLGLLADCLEQIGLRDERGLWDGALSTAEELIEHMVKAGRLIRVPGEGPERWEWVGNG